MTIVTPSYNQAQYLEATLRSVLLQGYPNLEYIVMDDGSTDHSVDIIRRYEPWLSYWQTAPNRGQSHVLNQGFARATGEVLGWLNSDDMLLPRALERMMVCRARHPDAVGWVGACQELDGKDRPLRIVQAKLPDEPADMGDWGAAAHFYQPSCFFSPAAFRAVGCLRESIDFVMDVDLWMRMARMGSFVATSEIVSAARLYPETKTFRDIPMRECEVIAANVINGAPQVARRRWVRQMQRAVQAAERDTTVEDLVSRFGYERVADFVPFSRLLSYGVRRARKGIRRRLGGIRKDPSVTAESR